MTQEDVPFRILSLNGGGCRGLFQAVFLSRLQKTAKQPLHQLFDLVAGTSTGSIVGMAVAMGIDIDRVVDLYRAQAADIFNPRLLHSLRPGPKYSQERMREALENVFGNRQLRDARTKLVVPATCIDRFQHRVFSTLPVGTSEDLQLSAVDVVMASCAAPTYFPSVKPSAQERSYIDGGMWANAPSEVGIVAAHSQLGIPLELMRVLSVGTGEFPAGVLKGRFDTAFSYDPRTIETLFEIMFASQQSAAEEQTLRLVGADRVYRVSCQLDGYIALDDAPKAISKMPALAEAEADRHAAHVASFLQAAQPQPAPQIDGDVPRQYVSDALVEAAGLTGFYPSRKYYSHRDDASSIDGYVSRARESLVMVSINLLTGANFDDVFSVLQGKLEQPGGQFEATLSLLNPLKAELIFSISPALGRSSEKLQTSISDTISELVAFRAGLSKIAQRRLHLRVHNTIPFGSAILIDHREDYGRIQIETKPYGAVLNDSFAFEVAPFGTSGFYKTLAAGYEALLDAGATIEEVGLDRVVGLKSGPDEEGIAYQGEERS